MKDDAGRTILALMTVTVIFSLIGEEVNNASGAPNKPGDTGFGVSVVPVNLHGQAAGSGTNPFLIILGGTLAAGILTLIAHAGEAGERIGVGLALVATVTSTLVYGGPVWNAANNAFGSTPTTPLAQTTPTATPTATATALTQAAAAGIA